MMRRPPRSTLFPTRRSSDLAGVRVPPKELLADIRAHTRMRPGVEALGTFCRGRGWHFSVVSHGLAFYIEDRKSTRLNSSHVEISYAVFCLKKKRTAVTNTFR